MSDSIFWSWRASAAPGAPAPGNLLLVARRSPDWASLASDFAQGRAIDPARYLPSETVPGFPKRIVELIALWNRHMRVDFFSCRSRLKDIAEQTMAKLPGARRVSYDAVETLPLEELRDCVIFFHDDDDWFSPEMPEIIAEMTTEHYDVCVFPLIRLGTSTTTFVRRDQRARMVVGDRKDFDFRYQSNNYGLNGKSCGRAAVLAMKDHVVASDYASSRSFRDVYLDRIIGVTAKTPCSASILPVVFAAPEKAREQVKRYVDAVTSVAIPGEFDWLKDRVSDLADLFSQA